MVVHERNAARELGNLVFQESNVAGSLVSIVLTAEEQGEGGAAHSPFGIDLVGGFLAVAVDAVDVIGVAAFTRILAVALDRIVSALNWLFFFKAMQCDAILTFDFFMRQRSQALQTRFRGGGAALGVAPTIEAAPALECVREVGESGSSGGVGC